MLRAMGARGKSRGAGLMWMVGMAAGDQREEERKARTLMGEKHEYDVAVIGAGVVGCAVARELSRWDARVCVVDRALDVAGATSRANSGIAHAGFDAAHGTLKARYNVLGSHMMADLARELGFSYVNNGSLVLAFTDEERESLRALLENGRANGVEGLRLVGPEELRELEPQASPDAREALWAPTGAIVNPYEMTLAFAENAAANGAGFLLGHEVIGISFGEGAEGGFAVALRECLSGTEFELRARCIVNAAGVFADRIAAMAGVDVPAITARRGEYVLLDKRAGRSAAGVQGVSGPSTAVRHTMFRAPSAAGKGVLVSPTVDGNIIVGPNVHAVDRDARGGAVDTTREGIEEVLGKARALWPSLPEGQVITRFAGLRATPESRDFVLGEAEGCPRFFNAAGIESPGLTAAPAIGVDLAALVAERLGAVKRSDFSGSRVRPVAFADMNADERAAAIAADPAWGRMVCRCEQVAEAEIRAAVRGDASAGALPATTLDAVKWRTRAGMGRCHGGFCSPQVARIIAEETGCTAGEVLKRDAGSCIGCAGGDAKAGVLGLDEEVHRESAAMPGDVDIAVVGGGAAGIAAALAAVEGGVAAERVLLIDRESALGGILKQCIHPGFGLERYREELTGPEYAARDVADLSASGVRVMQGTTVTSLVRDECDGVQADGSLPYTLQVVGPQGAHRVTARCVVLATGSRERSVGQLGIDGDRPAGVYSAGSAQHLMNLMGTLVGREVVLYGSGDIGLIMARRLAWEGAHVKACVVRGTRPSGLRRNVKQCLEDNGIPILLTHAVTRVVGDGARVCGVEICETDPQTKAPIWGTERVMECDTLLLSCGLIPEQDLLIDAGGAAVERGSCETTWPGVFLCGNAAGIHDIVDHVTEEGERIGRAAAQWVLGEEGAARPADADSTRSDSAKPRAKANAGAGKRAQKDAAEVLDIPEGAEEITCICCPVGCTLHAALDEAAEQGVAVVGNRCKRGIAYAVEELTAPRRTLTTIVRCVDRLEPVSVRTDATILKSDIPACLSVLRDVCVSAPIAIGDVIVSDICGTGANVVATKAVEG